MRIIGRRKLLLPLCFFLFALCLTFGLSTGLSTASAGAEEEKAGVVSASCSVACWDGEGVDKLTDGNDATYMNPTSKAYTIKVELDGYYHLTGFRWYALQGYYPYGDVSVSLNGGVFEKWTDFTFSDDNYYEDPALGEGFLLTHTGEAYAKYILVNVTGGPQEAVATREFSIYGTRYTPDRVDPEGLSIAEKNADGAYNTADTPCDIGDAFSLNAVQANPASIEKIVWTSGNTSMLSVDEFGNVTVLRGGVQPYYTVKAETTAPDGTKYSDEIKIYIKPIANIASAGKLTYSNIGYYWRPQMAFDGITKTFGNWVQPVAGVTEYFMACNFGQEIKFGKVSIHIGVSAPREIEVLGRRANGSYQSIRTFGEIAAGDELDIEDAGSWYGFRFNIRETATGMSTIYDIQIFNHESFPLSDIKQTTDVTENRGPGASGVYVPEYKTGPASDGSYGTKFSPDRADAVFTYKTGADGTQIALCVISCVLGAGLIGVAAAFGIIINKKRK